MLKVYICEDDLKQLNKIKSIIEKTIIIEAYDMELVLASQSPYDIINHIETSIFTGIYFLDIDLKSDIDGFSLSKIIRKNDPGAFIIFVTANGDLLHITFEYRCQAMDYIVKDANTNIKERIANCLAEANKLFATRDSNRNKVLIFKHGGSTCYEEFSNIVLIETNTESLHKISLYSTDRAVDLRTTLKEIMENVDDRFIKCSGSCIINIDMIRNIDRKERIITMKTGQTVIASTRFIRPILRKISSHKVFS